MCLFHFVILLFSIFIFNSCDGADDSQRVEGCTDPNAINFNSNADENDDSCEYSGCIDLSACNYNPSASYDDGSCEYLNSPVCDCNGNLFDCNGECGGLAEYDECGECGGSNLCHDCAGVPYGDSFIDNCSDCVAPGDECEKDCDGIMGGGSYNDSICNLCDGCNLSLNSIYFTEDQKELWYNVNQNIYGFQLDVYGIEISAITDGDANAADFEILYENGSNFSRIFGYYDKILGTNISIGCGNLFNIEYTGNVTGIDNIVFGGILGEEIEVEYYTCD